MDYNSEHNELRISGIDGGLITRNVVLGSPGDLKNIPMGVVLTTINGMRVESASMFSELLQSPNETFTIESVGKDGAGVVDVKSVKVSSFMNGCINPLKYK